MAVTLEEIARVAKVSKATVSRALRNDRLIHSDTRSLVLEAAARLGYERGAKRPRKTPRPQPRLLFLLPPNLDRMGNYVVQSYLRGLTRATGELGCFLGVEEMSEKDAGKLGQRAHLPREIRNGSVDAVIVASRHIAEDIRALVKILPVISIQWNHGGAQSDLVSAYNTQVIEQMVRLFREKGHQKLAWVGYTYRQPASFVSERLAGFIKGCLELGIEIDKRNLFSDFQDLQRRGGISALQKSKITATLCVNDAAAHMVAEAAFAAGLRVPEDLSISGFDADSEPLPNGKVLTSYDPCFLEISRQAVYIALQRLRDPGAPHGVHLWEGRLRAGQTLHIVS